MLTVRLSGGRVEDFLICADCVGETFLKAQIDKKGENGRCYYCKAEGMTFTIEEMANEVEIALQEHYVQTASESSYLEYLTSDEENPLYGSERAGEPVAAVISWCTGIDEAPAEDIRGILAVRHYDGKREESPFEEGAYYIGKGIDDAESRALWIHLEESLATEARYFNPLAEDVLTETFEGLIEYRTHDARRVIVNAGPGTEISTIYRARVFQSEEKLLEALKRPDMEIGSPPPSAARSGRMNPLGVGVFYGAIDPGVALAEVRPPVGSRVVIAGFEIIRSLCLLDLDALQAVDAEGSIFDRSYIRKKERSKFLKWLSERITRPVMPDDELFEYLPTQAIADFLATRTEPTLDGILYPSVQDGDGNLNVVLFHKASRVEGLDVPGDAEVSVSAVDYTRERPSIDYHVWEKVPSRRADDGAAPDIHSPFLAPYSTTPEAYDAREPALRLTISTVEVRYVDQIEYKTQNRTIGRSRYEAPASQL
ncbi:MAG TPA: RES family NAD+ phosphorylase [Pyrinomonadaceae bacterium]|nr:RES family NAD+ phosphorylase [Pyrinomonadaceae bacterium]